MRGLSLAAPDARLRPWLDPVAMGLAAGNALVVPGAAMLAYIGMLQLSVGEMLLPGLLVAVPAVVLTTFVYLLMMERWKWWNTALDEAATDEAVFEASVESTNGSHRLPSLAVALAPI